MSPYDATVVRAAELRQRRLDAARRREFRLARRRSGRAGPTVSPPDPVCSDVVPRPAWQH